MFFIAIMRIRYIWIISKVNDKETNIMFRNQEGDWSILFLILLILNKSRFDQYKFSYQPILRHFYLIIVALFVVYSVLQLTQFVVLTRSSLITQEVTLESSHIKGYSVKNRFYGCKFIVTFTEKEKIKKLSFFTTNKNRAVIEKRFKEQNVNIV